jgi:hypothetical protein
MSGFSGKKESTPAAFFKSLRDKVTEPFAAIGVKPLPGTIVSKAPAIVKPSAPDAEERKPAHKMMKEEQRRASAAARRQQPHRVLQLESLLSEEDIDMTTLRKLAWNGIPIQHRAMVWQLLLGYLPTNKSRRETILTRKRKEYRDSVATYFNNESGDRTSHEGETMRQILVDLPRTSPDTPFFQQVSALHCLLK